MLLARHPCDEDSDVWTDIHLLGILVMRTPMFGRIYIWAFQSILQTDRDAHGINTLRHTQQPQTVAALRLSLAQRVLRRPASETAVTQAIHPAGCHISWTWTQAIGSDSWEPADRPGTDASCSWRPAAFPLAVYPIYTHYESYIPQSIAARAPIPYSAIGHIALGGKKKYHVTTNVSRKSKAGEADKGRKASKGAVDAKKPKKIAWERKFVPR
ncbi:hypothetical protein GGX14DRAFT_618898 [Mycena pura]|uniref:Uncharacterized protein n=1 Tax=Mycena pura TaxID=153505 RepID=A0AAD6VI81_9AGAR|nr:hypothetical protein GGX14DRAFT_618898 [Mycena pura]